MEMNVNTEVLKAIRAEKNWTQQHLADACDVSLRTIQRIEKTGVASSESIAALSSVYEIPRQAFVVEKQVAPVQPQSSALPSADEPEGLSDYRQAAIILLLALLVGFAGIFYSRAEMTTGQFQLALTVVSLASLFSFVLIGVSAHKKGLLKKLLKGR